MNKQIEGTIKEILEPEKTGQGYLKQEILIEEIDKQSGFYECRNKVIDQVKSLNVGDVVRISYKITASKSAINTTFNNSVLEHIKKIA